MTENDFYVALQGVLTKAMEAGWDVFKACDTAHAAINEFEEEVVGGDEDDE